MTALNLPPLIVWLRNIQWVFDNALNRLKGTICGVDYKIAKMTYPKKKLIKRLSNSDECMHNFLIYFICDNFMIWHQKCWILFWIMLRNCTFSQLFSFHTCRVNLQIRIIYISLKDKSLVESLFLFTKSLHVPVNEISKNEHLKWHLRCILMAKCMVLAHVNLSLKIIHFRISMNLLEML